MVYCDLLINEVNQKIVITVVIVGDEAAKI